MPFGSRSGCYGVDEYGGYDVWVEALMSAVLAKAFSGKLSQIE
jgi:hypothetical protein